LEEPQLDEMLKAYFRFYAELNDFLSPQHRQVEFEHYLKDRASIKDTIEALGVPHPEVDLILVNGESVNFSYVVQPGDHISVYPIFRAIDISSLSGVRPCPLTPMRFIADVHLGKLAIYLRLLGFDTLYQNNYADQILAELSSQERRILLTQDRALLKRSVVIYGYYVRSHNPLHQANEVLHRFNLAGQLTPLCRCLRCNGLLEAVSKESIRDRLAPLTRIHYDEFARCQVCEQIYWKGSHYERLRQLIDRFTM
jgi:uncharacterized protein with PIN domain